MARNNNSNRPQRSKEAWTFINNEGAAYAGAFGNKGAQLFRGMDLVYSNIRQVSPESQLIISSARAFYNAMSDDERARDSAEVPDGTDPSIFYAQNAYKMFQGVANIRAGMFYEAFDEMKTKEAMGIVFGKQGLSYGVSDGVKNLFADDDKKMSDYATGSKQDQAKPVILKFHTLGNTHRKILQRECFGDLERIAA